MRPPFFFKLFSGKLAGSFLFWEVLYSMEYWVGRTEALLSLVVIGDGDNRRRWAGDLGNGLYGRCLSSLVFVVAVL